MDPTLWDRTEDPEEVLRAFPRPLPLSRRKALRVYEALLGFSPGGDDRDRLVLAHLHADSLRHDLVLGVRAYLAGQHALPGPAVAAVLRDQFANPLLPPPHLEPAWLGTDGFKGWGLARTVYWDLAFDLLPVLADLLEEAGCRESRILNHLRGPGPHARGCWALDLTLQKK
jgi:hypothetical protein